MFYTAKVVVEFETDNGKVKKVKLALFRHRLIIFIIMLAKASNTKKPRLRGFIYSYFF